MCFYAFFFFEKLTSTKDAENKTTLLHYLVDIIEVKFADILTFSEEVIHVDRASRVSNDSIQKTLKQMDNSIKNLETDLKNAKTTAASEDDKFLEVMGVSFSNRNLFIFNCYEFRLNTIRKIHSNSKSVLQIIYSSFELIAWIPLFIWFSS